MRKHPRPGYPGDMLIALAALAVILSVSLTVYAADSPAAVVQVRVEDRVWVYDLKQDRTVSIPGPLGETEMVIRDGKVHVHSSPCRGKICIAAGEISRPKEWIICLPNRVFITIQGFETAEGEVDDVAF